MQVDVIDNLERLVALKSNWDDVYADDPEAQFFLTWDWLIRRLDGVPGRWFILAVRESTQDSHYVAFFPLRMHTQIQKNGRLRNMINMLGEPVSDYTGFLCVPGFEARAIPALGQSLCQRSWSALNLTCIRASKKRRQLLLQCFADRNLLVQERDGVDPKTGLNHQVAPFAALPDDWETYLAAGLSTNTRQKVRRYLRKVDGAHGYRVTHATEATIERDMTILLDFWMSQWAATHGTAAQTIVGLHRDVLTGCFADGCLLLPVLWRGDRPLAALSLLFESKRQGLLFYIGGRDPSYTDLPAGFVLHAHSIRYAIAERFSAYEFLRGDEPYKYSFATEQHQTSDIHIANRGGQNLGDGLDPLGVPEALRIAERLRRDGHGRAALLAYRQILDADPQCESALAAVRQITEAQSGGQAKGNPPAIFANTRNRTRRP